MTALTIAAERHCPFCKTQTGHMMADAPKRRLYECLTCFAVEVISKGGSSWWYHGWEHPDGRKVDGSGKHSRRSEGHWHQWWDQPA